MSERLDVIDELERRLVATYYGTDKRRSRLLATRPWVSAVAIAALVALVIAGVVALLPGGEAAPSATLAALDRAARAAERTHDTALGPGQEWYVRTVLTTTEPLPIPPRPGRPLTPTPFANTVRVESRTVREVWMVRDGTMRARDVTSMSFASRQAARRYGRKLQQPQSSTTRVPGNGLLSSPLGPQHLMSYSQLRALATSDQALLRTIERIEAKLRAGAPPAQQTPTTTAPTTSTIRHGGRVTIESSAPGTAVGRCCGSTPVEHRAVGDLNAVAWLLSMPVSPQVRAALYRTAASLPGVRYDGTARDSLGRRGEEISVGSGDDEMRLIFNEQTGALWATSLSGFGTAALARGFGPLVETIASEKVVSIRRTG